MAKFKFDIKQPSTKKGLALLGGIGALMFAGETSVVDLVVTETGVSIGGIIGSLITAGIALWETIRNETDD